MHYTDDDLKEHQKLLRRMATGKQTDPLKYRELNMKLMKQTLDNILHPKKDEEVNSFLRALRKTLADLLFKHENHPHLMFAHGQLDSLESILCFDPLQGFGWATRKLITANRMIHTALSRLSTNGTMTGGQLAKEILAKSSLNERHACLLAGTTLRQLTEHELVMRFFRGRFTCYSLTDTGKRALDLIRAGRL